MILSLASGTGESATNGSVNGSSNWQPNGVGNARQPRRASGSRHRFQPRSTGPPVDLGGLYNQVRAILDEARSRSARAVNTEMVRAYWLIGQAIVEHEQQGADRAEYGRRLIASLSVRLTKEFGRGFSKNNLWYMRQFYLTFPGKLNALRV